MARKPKWTDDDQVMLETLVERHGAAVVTDKAKLVKLPAPAPSKRGKGQPRNYEYNRIAVWLAVETLLRSGAETDKEPTYERIRKTLAKASPGSMDRERNRNMTAGRIKSLYHEAHKHIRDNPGDCVNLEETAQRCADEFKKRRGTAVVPFILQRDGRTFDNSFNDLKVGKVGDSTMTISAGTIKLVRLYFPAGAV
jgi:hypothetical protein